jgi:hypothetical protein
MGGVMQESSLALAERWRKHSRPLALPSSGALGHAIGSGGIGRALVSLPTSLPPVVTSARRPGFVNGLNTILMLGAAVAFAAAVSSVDLEHLTELWEKSLRSPYLTPEDSFDRGYYQGRFFEYVAQNAVHPDVSSRARTEASKRVYGNGLKDGLQC